MRHFIITVLSAWTCCLLVTSGCSPEKYKKQADDQVYSIIDQKWKPQFGEKANYRVSDVNAGPYDINIPELPTSGVINLTRAVAIATAHNRDYQLKKDDLYRSALALTGERHRFEPQFRSLFGVNYNNNRALDTESVAVTNDTGFDLLLGTGTEISTNIALDWVKFLSGQHATLGSVLSGSITQPLLRGSNPLVVKERLTQAERNTLYQIRSFNLYRQDFLVSIVNDYYRVLQALDQVRNAEATYNSLRKSEERIRMLAQAGQVPNFEVDQARQQTLQVYDDLVRANQNYQTALDEFKIRLAISPTVDISLEPNDLAILQTSIVSEPNYTEPDAIAAAVAMRLDLQNSNDQLEDDRRKVLVAEDALRADLDLTASASAASTDRTVGDIQFGQGNYNVGATLDLPLDRLNERNFYRQALLALEESKRSYDQDLDEVVLDVRQSLRDLAEASAVYQIQLSSRDLAARRVENVSMLLQAGRKGVTTRDLLDAQSDLLRAQNALTAAIVNHTIAKLRFFRNIGVLRVQPDGMWARGDIQDGPKGK